MNFLVNNYVKKENSPAYLHCLFTIHRNCKRVCICGQLSTELTICEFIFFINKVEIRFGGIEISDP